MALPCARARREQVRECLLHYGAGARALVFTSALMAEGSALHCTLCMCGLEGILMPSMGSTELLRA